MKLKVPFVKQITPNTCGICCVKMLAGYFGLRVSSREVLESIQLLEAGTQTIDLGSFLLEKEFAVEAYSFDLNLFSPRFAKLQGEKLY